MPYFAKHNVLFIHIPKTGGKSVEVALGLASSSKLNKLGQRSFFNRSLTFLQRLTTNQEAKALLHGTIDIALCAQHLTIHEINLLGLDRFSGDSTPRSFAVFRNPFERAVSTYRHYTPSSRQSPEDFERFCETWFHRKFMPYDLIAHQRSQLAYLVDSSGEIAIDRVLLFENFHEEFEQLCRDWGLPSVILPHIGNQSNNRAETVLTNKSKKLIEGIFEKDIVFHQKLVESRSG